MTTTDMFQLPDEADFPKLLDRALATREMAEGLRRAGGDPDAGQLRADALSSVAVIAAAAEQEYRTYRRLADARPAPRPVRPVVRRPSSGATGGVLPALGVLVPGLAAVAAAIFLLLGFLLRGVGLRGQFADELIVAGEIAAGVAAVATLCGLLWMVVVAARNRPSAGSRSAADAEVARALTAYQEALLTRGLLPFLRARLGDAAAEPRPEPDASPGEKRPRTGPGYSAPDFASPDFASPDFASPDFGSPDFSGPGGAAER
ncbi:hypothetical protein [Streptomyces catenulae]|uniref:Transmembrane protein n=1 Tax=Streptomyces catenulae TaxID=66875 RepID=A0ABV2YSE3_9ACTN|nr:hypothetical protein [Streptomyces catenulae]